MEVPMVLHPRVHSFCWSAFSGLPCPKKIAGIGWAMWFSAERKDQCSQAAVFSAQVLSGYR
jgi:hypothetical protein